LSLETLKNNRYRIVRSLGSGSTGEVYLVEDNLNNQQEVVLKLLRAYEYPTTEYPTSQNAPHFFEFEARAIAQLNHPNILPLLDYGTEAINGRIVPYLVTPYCPEGSLATWLAQRSYNDVLTLEDAARIVRQIADALQYAHNQGVIHRDVKSANVFIRNKLNGPPDMLLADFGFAQPLPGTQASGLDIRGTPGYMAPEQWQGQVVPASDQYALGVLVYQLLTGRLPFEGSIEQIRYEHLNSWPTPPSTINQTLSRELDVVVGRALAKKPGDRYPTVLTFGEAFTQAIRPAPAPPPAPVYLAAPPTPPQGINVGNVTYTPPPPTTPAPARKMSPTMIALITTLALLLVLGGIGIALYAFSNNAAQPSANATATAEASVANQFTATAQANGNANSTATANVNATGTASAHATSTANSNATATAQSHGNANATATANTNATATANANATATVLPAAQLSGNWVNPDTTTPQRITRMEITNNGTNISVHAFAACPPTNGTPSTAECDWGTKSNQYTGSPFKIVFVVNGITHNLAISTQGAQLKVIDGVNTYLFDKQ
jgi:serine/threonine protein kinase